MNFYKKNKKDLQKDLFPLICIIILPFGFYLYNFIPIDISVWKTKWFEIDSGFYVDANFYCWFLSIKILTICILSVWYLTCKYWWRFVLLVSIIVEVNKLINIIRSADLGFDIQFISIVGIITSVVYVMILSFISIYIGYYEKRKNYDILINEEINSEMIKLSFFSKENYKLVKKDLISLAKKKESMSKKEYLIKLLALRDRLTI
ncbi:hypothetical protein A9Q86_02505 [Flavobacteriales bacterium 33_180_T64]|nr:hypothetical protein A9Q86_02505 [Flavobacteriales bacterium 33_180_T64]